MSCTFCYSFSLKNTLLGCWAFTALVGGCFGEPETFFGAEWCQALRHLEVCTNAKSDFEFQDILLWPCLRADIVQFEVQLASNCHIYRCSPDCCMFL